MDTAKSLLIPGLVFEELGYEYVGPINGHNLEELMGVLTKAKERPGPVMVHIVTQKGKGYPLAEQLPVKYHGVTQFDVSTGAFHKTPAQAPSYTAVFGKTICEIAEKDPRVVAITAAMGEGTGLDEFSKRFPDRFYDVGIAEQHAVTFATGLACEGMRPVVAIYSTFLQRAFDEVMHDTCLMRSPVTFVLDRGGLVGADGPTHHGLYDLVYLSALPGIVVMAPKDEAELRHMLYTGINVNGPAAMRYPRGNGIGVKMDADFKALEIGKGEILREGSDIGILALGTLVYPCLEAASRLEALGPARHRHQCALHEAAGRGIDLLPGAGKTVLSDRGGRDWKRAALARASPRCYKTGKFTRQPAAHRRPRPHHSARSAQPAARQVRTGRRRHHERRSRTLPMSSRSAPNAALQVTAEAV